MSTSVADGTRSEVEVPQSPKSMARKFVEAWWRNNGEAACSLLAIAGTLILTTSVGMALLWAVDDRVVAHPVSWAAGGLTPGILLSILATMLGGCCWYFIVRPIAESIRDAIRDARRMP